jgi:hypothetical protein
MPAQYTWRGPQLLNATEAKVVQTMGAAGAQGEAELKVLLSTPGKGRTYVRVEAGTRRVHRASAPSQPPAPDFGILRGRSTHEVVLSGDDVITRVIENGSQALYLELGTEKIAPRPALRPLLPKLIAAVNALIKVRLL